MNEKALRILEFSKITDTLSGFAGSEPAKKMCHSLRPSSNMDWVIHAQNETESALKRILKNDRISFGYNIDVRPLLKAAAIGRMLSASELLCISRLLANVASVIAYNSESDSTKGNSAEEQESHDCLEEYFKVLDPLGFLSDEITRCILNDDELNDDASSRLRDIRNEKKVTSGRIQSHLSKMVNDTYRSYLQDNIITLRDGRYCIPVRAEYKSQVPGMVHDRSASGSTLFIEPAAIVELNNKLRELEIAEDDEIRRILSELSAKCSVYSDTINEDQKTITLLDFIFAKAKYALSLDATRPLYDTNGSRIIELRKARHPLLDGKTVVPIDIALGRDYNLLIITGPNTGGKTVSLKTVGLLTLMGQAGLHIPALDHSALAFFNEVYADIGDEQSIEQSLSTFSSHMTSIVDILKKADDKSLCLFDELGAGTDPEEGAALAVSILDDLHKKGICCMATTHYSELKIYALTSDGVENACCEFDVESLKPTYRLLTGIPGKSNAFAISAKLGLPEAIIRGAEKYISSEEESFENIVSDLEERRVQMENDRKLLDEALADMRHREKILADKEEKIFEKREKIIADARSEAKDILQDAKDIADESIRAFTKQGTQMKPSTMEKKRSTLREWISKEEEAIYEEAMKNSRRKKTSEVSPAPLKRLDPAQIKTGMKVHVESLGIDATVTSLADKKGNVTIQNGVISSKVKASDLTPARDPQSSDKVKSGGSKRVAAGYAKSSGIHMEINVIGDTVDDAVIKVDKYLDDACIAGLQSVRIIHGKGTGALKNAIHDLLRRSPVVDSFSIAPHGEGDAGVTVAKLK
ncbi:MAG: endonuclease MutS2 [Lachnospiraceae bacterium]|nr:endonuclease MutS2 [Lachnospiraceae bacterium]